jgi:hypothetical protein
VIPLLTARIFNNIKSVMKNCLTKLSVVTAAACFAYPAAKVKADDVSTNSATSPVLKLLNLMLDKGIITESEASKFQSQLAANTNNTAEQLPTSKWKLNDAVKNLEVFGDVRVRYEDRSATAPGGGGSIDLNRYRYAVRIGIRGELFDDYYYGVRLETGSSPRSNWVTMGGSSPGPYGKSAAGVNIGQAYLGWRPESWFDLTLGKMPNPLYTTTMVWSPNINPEGAAEHFKYAVGEVDFFANFGQFVYQDENPVSESADLVSSNPLGQTANNIFQVAWQGGATYNITTNFSAKIAATVYQYFGLRQSSQLDEVGTSPYYGDPFVGEGAYPQAGVALGNSGYGNAGSQPGNLSLNYPNNQVGLNDLLVLEIPFEVNYKFKKLDARIFGDVAYNLQGTQRAEAAAAGYQVYLNNLGLQPNPTAFAPQTGENKAYQVGFALASSGGIGLVDDSASKRHGWELRTYWQHVEQYALDPNLVDVNFFSGALNLQGIYFAAAYGFTDNLVGSFRYAHASRIDSLLGTGGTGTDIPQINPIQDFDLFQVDLTLKF